MRTKTRYREFKDGGQINSPDQKELPIEQSVEAAVEAPEMPVAAPVAVETPEQPQSVEAKPDEAALTLQKQLDDLRKSEKIQKNLAAQAAQQQPLPPEQLREMKLNAWRQSGHMNAEEEAFLKAHPKLIDFSDVTNRAANILLASGIKRGSKEYLEGVLHHFDGFVEEAAQMTVNPTPQPTPEFFKPPPSPATPAAPTPASFVSAPVSRTVPSPDRRHDELNPRSMTLTAEEVQIARASGISPLEYAKNKIRLAKEKEAGLRQT